MSFAHIAIDVPLRTTFTYLVPDPLQGTVRRGVRVVAPFGRKRVIGLCLGVGEGADAAGIEPARLKTIEEVLPDDPQLLDETYLKWLEFAADYYLAPIGQVIAQALPGFYLDLKRLKAKTKVALEIPARNSEVEIQVGSPKDLATILPTAEQSVAIAAISQNLAKFFPAVLHGVTGSGKTEVYIALIKQVLAMGRSALYLVPEIGLTPQTCERLQSHLLGQVLVSHSGMTDAARYAAWQACLGPKPRVLIGTRSALFSPFKNLGLVVIDEEHDASFKQEDRLRYHARDLAVARARLAAIPIVMGSATPSLETIYQANAGKYALFHLTRRIGLVSLPDIKVLDVTREREQTHAALVLSRHIHDALAAAMAKNRQAILFVGQRGFAQNAYCTACKKITACPNCSVGLKFHQAGRRLQCHYCDYRAAFSGVCGACAASAMTLLGFGTQTVEDEVRTMHPGLRVARLDSDTVTTAKKLSTILSDFHHHRIDCLIGTQMLAKGHDFKNVGFVGVVGIDAHLGLPDFRAAERAFQTLIQVSGRAGRTVTLTAGAPHDKAGRATAAGSAVRGGESPHNADDSGPGSLPDNQAAGAHVLVQSLMPDHASLILAARQDFQAFAELELSLRRELHYPPHSRLIQLRFLSNNEKRLHEFFSAWQPFLKQLKSRLIPGDAELLGPTEMPLAKIRGKHRHHLILKVRRGLKSQDIARTIIGDFERQKRPGIQLQVDVDPVNLL